MFHRAKNSRTRATRSTFRSVSAIALSLAVVGLAGCRDRENEGLLMGWTIPDPSQRHPIVVTQAPVFLDIETPRGSDGLSPSQEGMVRDFLATYKSQGEGELMISAPSGSRNEVAAMRTLSGVREVASSFGIPDHYIALQPYPASGYRSAPVKVSLVSYEAKPPKCVLRAETLSEDPRNENYHNFGCAQQQNIAAMVANPRDLIQPRTMDPRPAERGYVHWGKHIQGESTGAERSADEKSGNISDIGGN